MSLTSRHKVSPLTSAVQCDPHYSQSSHPSRRPAEGPSPPNPAERLPGISLILRSGKRCAALPAKVLWTVISKTIAWMAALIENNEGHIEHMVAVVSPCPISPQKKSFSQNLAKQKKKKRKKSERHHKGLSPSTLLHFLMSRCPLFWRRALRRSTSASSESCRNHGLSTADGSCAQITREMTSRSSLKRLWSVSLRAEDTFPAKAPGVRCAHRLA